MLQFGQVPTVLIDVGRWVEWIVCAGAGKPTGYDRVRNTEIGNKDFELDVLEEAYTTEHWLVRIYKVKDLTNRGNWCSTLLLSHLPHPSVIDLCHRGGSVTATAIDDHLLRRWCSLSGVMSLACAVSSVLYKTRCYYRHRRQRHPISLSFCAVSIVGMLDGTWWYSQCGTGAPSRDVMEHFSKWCRSDVFFCWSCSLPVCTKMLRIFRVI